MTSPLRTLPLCLLTCFAGHASELIGSWSLEDGTGPVMLTFLANGEFVLIQDGDPAADPSGQDGFERGVYHWDSETGRLESEVNLDTNGEWGFSHGIAGTEGVTAQVDGDTLELTIPGEGSVEFERVARTANPLVGSWWTDDPGGAGGLVVMTFLPDGSYFFAQDGADDDPDGHDGIERGVLSWNPQTHSISATIPTDTNGEWGFSHNGPEPTLQIHASENRIVLDDDNGIVATLFRVRPAVVETVLVEKSVRHRQTGEEETEPMTKAPDGGGSGGAHGFGISVEGDGVEGLAPPAFTLPAGATFPTEHPSLHNNGFLKWDGRHDEWTLGSGGWEAGTKETLDALFPNGAYTLSAAGETVTLQLSGDAYPAPPVAVLSGGAWANGTYIIDPAQPLGISLTPPAGFGDHAEDRIAIRIDGLDGDHDVERFHSATPSAEPLTYTLPASSLHAGQVVWVELQSNAAVDLDDALEDTLQAAVYSRSTWLRVEARTPRPDIAAAAAAATGEWQVRGYNFWTDSPASPHVAESFSGTAALTEKLPGLVYTLTARIEGEENDTIDLLVEGNALSMRHEEGEGHEAEYGETRLRIVDGDTLIYSDASTNRTGPDSLPYWFDGNAAVMTRHPLPAPVAADWPGRYTAAAALGFNLEAYGSGLYEDADEAGFALRIEHDGGNRYEATEEEDDETTPLTFTGDTLRFSETHTDPEVIYTDGEWRTEAVRWTDHVHALQLGGGRIWVVGSGAEAARLLPEDPEQHPGWTPQPPYLNWADVFSEILAKTDEPPTGGEGYDTWAETLGLSGSEASPDAKPFADGLPNLVRFAMNLGAAPTPDQLPAFTATTAADGTTTLKLEFRVRKNLTGLELVPQTSANLSEWEDVPASRIEPLPDDDAETERYRVEVSDTTGHLFLRLGTKSTASP